MIVEQQSNEFNNPTSPLMWEQFPSKLGQPQVLSLRKPRNNQSAKVQLHGTYTIFWQCPSSSKLLRYDITLNNDKSIKNFILDAADFFMQNSPSFLNLYDDIENIKLYIAKENGSKSTTYPPVSIHEVPTVFTLFKNQRKRYFRLEQITEDQSQNSHEESKSNSTSSSEMLSSQYTNTRNYRTLTKTADKITSIYSDKMKNSKIYNNSFHSQTNSPPSGSKSIQQTIENKKEKKQLCFCFCSD